MARPSSESVEPVVVGVSHKTAPAALRDRLFAEEAELPILLAALQASGLDQAVLLSTCDRTEIQTVAANADAAVAVISRFFAQRAGVPVEELLAAAYRLEGEAALRHVFAVAASLDSAVVGEPQVLGQVKEAHRLAKAAGLVGTELDRLLQAAFAAAKRVRSETAIAERAVSVAAVATQLARDLHGDLGRCAGLILGAGEMGEFLAEHLRQAGFGRWTVAHGSLRRAVLAARRFGGHFVGLGELEPALAQADVVLAALGTGRTVIDAAMVRAALRARRRRPILFIDAAVPCDVVPDVASLDGAFLYDLDDLERLALEGRAGRSAAAAQAWAINDSAAAALRAARAARQAVPALVALRRRFEVARAEVLANGGDVDAAEATRLLINRLLHDPSQALRRLAAEGGEGPAAEALLRRLFELNHMEPPEAAVGDEEKDA
jgi:glutamyl-tRNA reductase